MGTQTGLCLVLKKSLQGKDWWMLRNCKVDSDLLQRGSVACLIADKLWKATKYSFSCPNSRWSQITPKSRYRNEPLLPISTLLTFFTKQLLPSDLASSRTLMSKDWILLPLAWTCGSGQCAKISCVIVENHTYLHVEKNILKFWAMMGYKLVVKYRKISRKTLQVETWGQLLNA